MSGKAVSIIMVSLLLMSALTLAFNIQPVKTEPTTIIVPDDYPTIQEAINHADYRDTVFVRAGMYHESVAVAKPLSLIGENKYTTIIDGNHTGNVVYVTGSAVNITGFTIRNSGQDSKAGILVGRLWDIQSSGNNISGNIIASNHYGILLAESFNSTISNNIVTNNTIGVQDQSRDYDCDIWTMNADGSNQTLLTTDELWDDGPEWYPNPSKILFERVSNPFAEGPGSWDIWTMNTDGTNQTQLTADSKVNMLGGWSPDGSQIVYSSARTGNPDIWTMDSDGTNNRQLTADPSIDTMPTYNPDGSKLIFISNRAGSQDMWIMNADGTNQTRLTSGIPVVMGGSWSPDGTRIVFHSVEGGQNGNWDMWMINCDGTSSSKLYSSPFREAFPHWSPDGTKIAYGSDEAGSWDIWMMNSDGTNRTRITPQEDVEEICSWSPDGSKLAFARAEWSLPSCNKITHNTITDSEQEGVRLQQAVGVSLEGNLIQNNGHGLTIQQGYGHSIINNMITNNTEGIAPGGFAGAGIGIYLNMAGSNTLRNNSMSDNGYNFCIDAHSYEEYSNDVDDSNTVNGKPIYYWVNEKSNQVPADAGCVLLVNCTDIIAEDLNLSSHCGFGISLWFTTNSTIGNVTSSCNANGIGLTFSSGNTIADNIVTDVFPQGGIWLVNSPYNTLRNNIMLNSTFSFLVLSQRPPPGVSMQDWDNDIDDSNRIDGKPIYYLVNQHDMTVPNDGALVYLVNCSNMTVRDTSVSNNYLGIALVNTNNSVVTNVATQTCSYGVLLALSADNLISNSTMTNGIWQSTGAYLYDSHNNTLSGNLFSNMTGTFQTPGQPPPGIGLIVGGVSNRVFHNNFMNNAIHVGIPPGEPLVNAWDDGYPSGGNYYSGYNGSDIFNGPCQNETGSDGIGDTPYVIDVSNQDNYPLIKPYGIQHDVGITSIALTKTVVGQGYSLKASARIVNYGINTETFNITLCTSPQPGISDNSLVGYWEFDEGSGTVAYDSSGNNNTGILVNGPTWVQGRDGRALSFDGVDDYVEVNDSASLDVTNQITAECWVKWDHIDGSQYESMLFGKAAYGVLITYYMELQDGKVRATIGDGDPLYGWHHVCSTTSPVAGVWYHLAMTYDGQFVRIFVNGVEENSVPYEGAIATSDDPLNIGRFQAGIRYVDGIIDELKIYNRALSPEEIRAEYERAPETVQTQTVTLTGRASSAVTLIWDTTGFAYGNYTISACVTPVSGETDTTENTLTDGWVFVSIPGDINADRKVDLKDVFAVGKAYGTTRQGPNPQGRVYSPNCDINDDDKIDLKDYFTTCKNFGKSW